jgi:hypothetical protein
MRQAIGGITTNRKVTQLAASNADPPTNASHQVLILSTDTEVDRHCYQALEPHIARAYHLRYDEESRATHAEEGYFWEQTQGASDSRSRA